LKTDLNISLLLLLQVLEGSLVDLLFQRGGMEVTMLKLFGLAQRLLGVPDNFWGLGVLIDETGDHLPTLIGACKEDQPHHHTFYSRNTFRSLVRLGTRLLQTSLQQNMAFSP